MIADFFTKPLQGMLFYKYQAIIMNLDQDVIPVTSDLGSVLENEDELTPDSTDKVQTVKYRIPNNKQKDVPRGHSSA